MVNFIRNSLLSSLDEDPWIDQNVSSVNEVLCYVMLISVHVSCENLPLHACRTQFLTIILWLHICISVSKVSPSLRAHTHTTLYAVKRSC